VSPNTLCDTDNDAASRFDGSLWVVNIPVCALSAEWMPWVRAPRGWRRAQSTCPPMRGGPRQFAATTVRIPSPYASRFFAPMPVIPSRSPTELGRAAAIARRVASPNTM